MNYQEHRFLLCTKINCDNSIKKINCYCKNKTEFKKSALKSLD